MKRTLRKFTLGLAAALLISKAAPAAWWDGPEEWWNDPKESAGAPIAIPAHDINRACEHGTMLAGSKYSSIMLSTCIKSEQNAYDWLKAVWPDAPESAKRRAVAISSADEQIMAGYYHALKDALVTYIRVYRTNHHGT